MTLRFVDVPAEGIGPYVEGLRALERDIAYPIEGDAFTIDHGPEYAPFFSTLGEAHFLIALDDGRVVGTMAGMLREAIARGERIPSFYSADIKLARSHRGRGVVQRMLAYGLFEMIRQRQLGKWRYAYIAAMRGARGDVMKTVRGAHLGHLARPAATLAVYFADAAKLAALPNDAPAPPRAEDGLDLSPPRAGLVEPPGLASTAGRKDLRLRSTGEPWPLVHLPLGPSRWTPTLGAHLRACGDAIARRARGETACFALDTRLDEHIAWLERNGVAPGATATVYALNLSRRARGAGWLHLATSEI